MDGAMGDRWVLDTLGVGATTLTLAVRRDGEATRIGKRLLPRFRSDEEMRARLSREGDILRRLGGRGAPRFVEAGEDASGLYLVMERLAMPSLGAQGTCTRTDRTRWVDLAARAALEALAAVHEAEDDRGPLAVVHSDLSPDNILVADDARSAAIIDFGLSQWRDDPGPAPGAFRGTLAYVAPEVARGERAHVRSDLFALAASFLAVASGAPPREGSDFPSQLAAAAEVAIDAYAERASRGLSPEVARLLVACVRFDARDRPASAREALARLGRLETT